MITFINPWAFIWLFLAVPIVLLYLVRSRKYTHPTAAGDIWRESISLLDPRFWWRPWRLLVSLIVQLAILLAFVVAMAEPCLRPPQRIAVIIDCTESMADALKNADNTVSDNTATGNTVSGNTATGNTVSGNTATDNTATDSTVSGNTATDNTAASEVRQKLEQMVEKLGYHDRIALIAAESPARILCRTTSDRTKVLNALDDFFQNPQTTDNAGAVADALDVARALVARTAGEKLDPRTQNIIFISDGCFPGFDQLVADPCHHWLPVGKSSDNFAMTKLGLRRDSRQGNIVLLAEFTNFSGEKQAGTFTATAGGANVDQASVKETLALDNGVSVLKTFVLADSAAQTSVDVLWQPEKAGTGRSETLLAEPFSSKQVFIIGKSAQAGQFNEYLSRCTGVKSVKILGAGSELPSPLPTDAVIIYLGDIPESQPETMPNVPTISFGPNRTTDLWTVTPTDSLSEASVKSAIDSVNLRYPQLWSGVDVIGQTFETIGTVVPGGDAAVLVSDASGRPLAWLITPPQADGSVPVKHLLFNCRLSTSDWLARNDFGAFVQNLINSLQPGNSDPIIQKVYEDENRIVPRTTFQPYTIPGEDIIPLWTILGLILLAVVCVEWCLYQRRWLE